MSCVDIEFKDQYSTYILVGPPKCYIISDDGVCTMCRNHHFIDNYVDVDEFV